MLASRLHIYWARVVIELPQGAALGSGDFHDTEDMPFVVDANGLPTLPGAGIAGALHSALRTLEVFDVEKLGVLFGALAGGDPKLSELAIDFGYLHNQSDQPVSGLVSTAAIAGDPVLMLCKKGITRQHAPHNHEGVAADGGLHNRQHLPAGARFTLELRLECSEANLSVLEKIIQTMCHPLFRLGGGKNSGIGAVKVVRCSLKYFDLTKRCQLKAWMNWPKSIDSAVAVDKCDKFALAAPVLSHVHQLTLTLPMQSYWCIGGGANDACLKSVNEASNSENIKTHPLVEQAINWAKKADKQGEVGSVVKNVVVPGSSIKGVLAHQMAFEVRARRNPITDENPDARPAELIKLLGSASTATAAKTEAQANNAQAQNAPEGAVGRFWLQDLLIPIDTIKACFMTYNVIDQLSKGVVSGGLFTEKVCLPHVLNMTGYCAGPMEGSDADMVALNASLAMLCDGRLAIGNHSAAGHGFAEGGTATWEPPVEIAEIATPVVTQEALEAAR